MPPRQRAAQSSTSQAILGSKGDSEALEAFLGGFVPAGAANKTFNDHESENAIAVQIKLLKKSSDVTKQKALGELIRLLESSSDEAVYPYGASIVETVIQNASYTNPIVRKLLFNMLKAFVDHGKQVKKTLAPELNTLTGVWIMAMSDMEQSVRSAAKSALEAAFSADKRPELLLQFESSIIRYAIEKIEESVDTRRPLQDDQLDPRCNTIFSALGSLAYMAKQVSVSQAAIVNFITENGSFATLLPSKNAESQKYFAHKTPMVRSAVLSLLRDVVSVCPSKTKTNQMISNALLFSFSETNPVVLSRAWELLLFWCKANVTEMIDSLPQKFFDRIVDSCMSCTKTEVGEVIYPCLFPLLTQISKDSRCAGILEEFCNALLEKLRILGDTPNVGVADLKLVLSALMQCWELHCVRHKGTDTSDESVELFSESVDVLCTLMQSENKRIRYFACVKTYLSQSMLKTAQRNEGTFKDSMECFLDSKEAKFPVLTENATDETVKCFAHLRAATVGLLVESCIDNLQYTKLKSMMDTYAADTLQRFMEEKDGQSMAILCTEAPKYIPEKRHAEFIVDFLANYLVSASARPGITNDDEISKDRVDAENKAMIALVQSIIPVVLEWNYADLGEKIVEATKDLDSENSVKGAVTEHYLQNSDNLKKFLVTACENSEFDDIKKCVSSIEKYNHVLSSDDVQAVKASVLASLSRTFDLLKDIELSTSSSNTSEADSESNEESESSESDTDEEGSSSTDEENESADKEENGKNEANEVLYQVVEWCFMLNRESAFSEKILKGAFHDDFLKEVSVYFMKLTIAVAPKLYPEQYISVKALRLALQNEEDSLIVALDLKRNYLKTSDFHVLVSTVSSFMDAYEIPLSVRETIGNEMFTRATNYKQEETTEDSANGGVISLAATHQLQFLFPFSSESETESRTEDLEFWKSVNIQQKSDSFDGLSLFDGYFALDELDITLEAAVRTAQLLRLIDYYKEIQESEKKPRVFLALLRAASRREVFCPSINKLLFGKILPSFFFVFQDESAAKTFAEAMNKARDKEYLLCTLGAVIRDMAKDVVAQGDSVHLDFLQSGRNLMSSVPLMLIDTLYSTSAPIKISEHVTQSYTTFFRLMDQAANVMKDNMMIHVDKDRQNLIREALASLPVWDIRTGRLTLIIHRHLHTVPVVDKASAASIIDFAQKQRPIDCLELLAELSCTRILEMDVFSDLVRTLVDSLRRCYSLRHLPSNGRLQKFTPNKLVPDGPVSFEFLRRVAIAAVYARHGVVIHSRMDDVLRSTVNLVIFDVVCEAISQLRNASNEKDVLPLAKLISFTTEFLRSLSTFDVSVFRASEASVTKIAAVFSFANAWFTATPISKLEAIGMETVSGVLCCACLLANLTLVGSKFHLHAAMKTIQTKHSLKPVRQEFSSSNQAKVNTFRRFNQLIGKTYKQKVLLFPFLLSLCVSLTTPPTDEEVTELSSTSFSKEYRQQLFHLLDLIFVLLLSPTFPKAKRLEETFLGALVLQKRESNTDARRIFDTSTLTHVDSPNHLEELSKAAAATFAHLLKGNTLTIVKSWLETIERKGYALFMDFVSTYLSPILVEDNLRSVMSHSPDHQQTFAVDENFTVQVSFSQKLINLTYEMEDIQMVVRISYPDAFPLRQPLVESTTGRENAISSEKWRSWMLKMVVLLFDGSSNIWECIELFHRNMDAHFSGQEPCPICFAVVNAINHKLPDKKCSICRNASFHSYCLCTWWGTSGQMICPLCRSPWV